MAKKKAAKKKGAKSDKPASAAEIKKLEQEAKAVTVVDEPLEVPEVTRSLQEIINDRVQIAPGHIGLTMADETPIEEHLAVLDWTSQMGDHVQFMIGDVLNNGAVRWGHNKYKEVMDRTGRKYNTLAQYASVAARIPIAQRQAALTFEHHRVIAAIGDDPKIEKVLKKVAEEAHDGERPAIKELRIEIGRLKPRRKPKKVTSGKHGKKGKKVVELPPYEPTAAETELLEEGEMAVDETAKLLKPDGKLEKVLKQLDNKTKQRWLSKLDPIVLFFKNITNAAGY